MDMIRPGNNLLDLLSRTMFVKSAANPPREQRVYGNSMSTSYTVKPPSPPEMPAPAVISGAPKDITPEKGDPTFGYRGEANQAPVGSSGEGKRVKLADIVRSSLFKKAAAALPTPAKFDEKAYLDRMYHMDGPEDHQTQSGNPMYDSLSPEQRAQQRKYNTDRLFSDLYKDSRRVGRNTTDQTKAQVDAEGGVGNWGNGWLGKSITDAIARKNSSRNYWLNKGGVVGNVGAVIADPWRAVTKGISYITSSPKGTSWSDWSKQYDQAADQDAGQLGHDIANNFQLQGNALQHGFGQTLRWGASKLDPRTWGSGYDARMKRMEYDNALDNASDLYHERADRIVNNFEDKTLSDMNSTLGMLNYGANAAVGEFAGGELATAGVGAAAKGIGRGVQAATNSGITGARYLGASVGSKARNLENARKSMVAANGWNRTMAPELRNAKAFRMQYAKDMTKTMGRTADPAAAAANKALRQQWMQRAGQSRVGGFITEAPYRFAHSVGNIVAAPFNVAGSALSTSGQSAVADAVWQPITRAVAHPVQAYRGARAAIANAAHHPFSTAWKPVKKVWGVAMHPNALGVSAMHEAAGNAAAGDYAGAAGAIGTMGAFGAVGL